MSYSLNTPFFATYFARIRFDFTIRRKIPIGTQIDEETGTRAIAKPPSLATPILFGGGPEGAGIEMTDEKKPPTPNDDNPITTKMTEEPPLSPTMTKCNISRGVKRGGEAPNH